MSILSRSDFDRYEKCGRFRDLTLAKEQDWIRSRHGDAYIFDLPCGHCLNCRLNYAKKWSQRCLLESKCWSENFFVTLTYDDENLPAICDYSTGEFMCATLVPDDVKDFNKRLREYYRTEWQHVGIRFYLAGEYGDHTFRPHYHVIYFNLPIFDLQFYSTSPLGDVYYNSPTLSKLWGKGHVVVGEVTAQSAAYVARYCQKKAKQDIDYDAIGVHKEFVRMSNRPGIAYPYFKEHWPQIYQDDIIYLPNGQTATPPRYFDDQARKMGLDVDEIKKGRMLTATILNNQKVDEVSRDFYSYLDDLEKEFEKKSRALGRGLC